jgi:hypothetical protein
MRVAEFGSASVPAQPTRPGGRTLLLVKAPAREGFSEFGVADLIDSLMPFTHPSVFPSMSRLASPFHSR